MARTTLQLSLRPSSIHILALLYDTALARRSSNFALTTTVIFLSLVLATSSAEQSAMCTPLVIHPRLPTLRNILLLADGLPFFWQHHFAEAQQLGNVGLLAVRASLYSAISSAVRSSWPFLRRCRS